MRSNFLPNFNKNRGVVDITVSIYVKLYGRIAELSDGSRVIKVFNLQKLKEMNQITHHMLSCINTSLDHLQSQGTLREQTTKNNK